MNDWQPMDTAPDNQWVLVSWDGGLPSDPQGGPWDYGMSDRNIPPPPAMVAIRLPRDRGYWRAYSEDGGIYGTIPTPTKWRHL